MAVAIDKKSPWTAGHSKRVTGYATNIAKRLQVDDEFIEEVRITSLLHDIGKIGIPDTILNSPERLSEDQLSLIRGHAAIGAEIIKNVKHFEFLVSGI